MHKSLIYKANKGSGFSNPAEKVWMWSEIGIGIGEALNGSFWGHFGACR